MREIKRKDNSIPNRNSRKILFKSSEEISTTMKSDKIPTISSDTREENSSKDIDAESVDNFRRHNGKDIDAESVDNFRRHNGKDIDAESVDNFRRHNGKDIDAESVDNFRRHNGKDIDAESVDNFRRHNGKDIDAESVDNFRRHNGKDIDAESVDNFRRHNGKDIDAESVDNFRRHNNKEIDAESVDNFRRHNGKDIDAESVDNFRRHNGEDSFFKIAANTAYSFLNSSKTTQKHLRISAVIGVTFALLFLLVLFVTGVTRTIVHRKGEAIIVERKLENLNDLEIDLNAQDRRDNFTKFAQNRQNNRQQSFSLSSSLRVEDTKIYKDSSGKAKQLENGKKPVVESSEITSPEQLRDYRVRLKNSELNKQKILSEIRENVDNDRKKILDKELKFWEPGSDPLRIILISTWGTNYNFLSDVLKSHPGVFFHQEPLSHLGLKQVRSGSTAFEAQRTLHRLLDCEYQKMPNYINYLRYNSFEGLSRNYRIWEYCKNSNSLCSDADFLSKSCEMFPIQLLSSVRLRLNLTQILLNDQKLRVKVLFLVRDPREVLNFRYSKMPECLSSPDCSSPDRFCRDLEGDLKVSKVFNKFYPERFLTIRSENLNLEPESEIRRILTFLNLNNNQDLTKVTQNYKSERDLKGKFKKVSNTQWKSGLTTEQINNVQNSCAKVIKILQ